MSTSLIVIQRIILGCCLSILFSSALLVQAAEKPSSKELFALWAKLEKPSAGETVSIGTYAAGCLRGAQPLPLDGVGYQVMRAKRKRYYGHPVLLQFLKDFGKQMQATKTGILLIGDMGRPRGGPMISGHTSHQIGLDVDLWYETPRKAISKKSRESLSSVSVVDRVKRKLHRKLWTKKQDEIVEFAAKDPRVERIFVHPFIKEYFCKTHGNASWIYKLRPWWGHDDHFHVRLKCPAGAKECVAQEALNPADNGCSEKELAWWSSDEAAEELAKRMKAFRSEERVFPELPKQCEELQRK